MRCCGGGDPEGVPGLFFLVHWTGRCLQKRRSLKNNGTHRRNLFTQNLCKPQEEGTQFTKESDQRFLLLKIADESEALGKFRKAYYKKMR
jgi:hypothetical protein